VKALLRTYPPMDVAAAFGTALEARVVELDDQDLNSSAGRSAAPRASLAGGL
jgi:hypothetical protein